MPRRKPTLGRVFLRLGFGSLAFVIAVAVALEYADFEGYKRDVEDAAAAALGMEVHIDGRLGIGVLSGPHIVVEKLRVRNRDTELALVKEVRLSVELAPLLEREVRISEVRLRSPTIFVERDRDGGFNFETATDVASLPKIDALRIAMSQATFVYADAKSGERIEAKDCGFRTNRFRLTAGKSRDLLRNLALQGELRCIQVRSGHISAFDVTLALAAERAILELSPIALRLFGARGSGLVRVDLSRPMVRVEIEYSLAQLRLEQLFHAAGSRVLAHGPVDVSARLSWEGHTARELKRSTAGTISIRGAHLTMDGTDVDRALAKYESSQNFNLVDLGAIALAGPFGLVATKGYGFASAASATQGNTAIRVLVADWTIKNGIGRATDVAMTTAANRIAVKGAFDLVHERFENVVIAVVDAKGCVKVRQTLHGPFHRPTLDTPGVFASLAGPIVNLLSKPISGHCAVFYAGSVAPPA